MLCIISNIIIKRYSINLIHIFHKNNLLKKNRNSI
nr:MAG TPA: hypothetical protein [Caudoviricetes sp.]